MKPGWTAGVTRGRLLLGSRVGAQQTRVLAGRPTLGDALAALAGSAYGERVAAGGDLSVAERGVAETLLWQLRILAGWLPPAGAGLVRTLAAWFEIANIDARLAAIVGGGREPRPFELGTLSTAWTAIAPARTVQDVTEAIGASAWGEPDTRTPEGLARFLRVAWARRVRASAPGAASWVAGAIALMTARDQLAGEVVTAEAQAATDAGAWALPSGGGSDALWLAEARWWDRVEGDAQLMLRTIEDEAVVLAVVALLAADATRTSRALRSAALGGEAELGELVDALD